MKTHPHTNLYYCILGNTEEAVRLSHTCSCEMKAAEYSGSSTLQKTWGGPT